MAIHTQHRGEYLAALKGRGAGLTSWSVGLHHLCVLAAIVLVITGILSSSYLELSYDLLTENSSQLRQPESIPIFPNFVDSAASGRWLKISQEDSGEAISYPNTATSGDTVREDALISANRQSSDLDQTAVEEELTVPSVEQAQLQQEDTRWAANQSATHSEDIEVGHSTGEAQEEDQEGSLRLLPEGGKQDGEPGILVKGADHERVDLKDALNGSPAEMILLPSEPSNLTSSKGECDFTAGKWVPEPAGPLYSFDRCRVLSQPQNCQQNGRPDNGYEFYKWEPEQCVVSRFDPNEFLELMRGKTLAFIGDSLARNQMESLMCILLQAAEPRSRSSKQIHRWYFPSHKFTLMRMWSSWLVQSRGEFPPSLAPPNITKLNLTELDDYAYHLPKIDVTILSSGHWWVRKTAYFLNGEMLGGMGWPWLPSHGVKKLDNIQAFGVAMNTALRNVGEYPGYKGLTILRTYTPDHYTGGSWDTGGSCTGETKPYDKGPVNSFNERMYEKQLQAFKANTEKGKIMTNGSKLRMLDVYPILNYRGDGHAGPYRSIDPLKQTSRDAKGRPPPQDCLHWCMPGPVDTMNELLFQMLREELQ